MSSSINFSFPYEAYPIQNDFMNALYKTLTDGKIGIFESPTGTGKSLSLICGSLKWLQDHQELQQDEGGNEQQDPTGNEENDEPDWLRAFKPKAREQELLAARRRERREALKSRIERARRMEVADSIFHVTGDHRRKRFKEGSKKSQSEQAAENEFLVEDYYSDDEEEEKQSDKDNDDHLTKEVRDLLAKLEGDQVKSQDEDKEEDEYEELKIFYASRTHSQLTQFIKEIAKTRYKDDVWTVALGSRKNLCINKKVQNLETVQRINDACLELQKNGEKGQCPYLPSLKEKAQWDAFRDHALAKVRDIEDLVKVGENLSICPYYGSRHTLKPAQLVVLPYQHLLHGSTRESMGISLKNSIVIIDEAHNLIETVTTIHTVMLTLVQLRTAFGQLSMYLDCYRARLAGKNVVYIKQLMTIIRALLRLLEPISTKPKEDRVFHPNEFVHELRIDHINMFKIKRYLEKSSLARKLNGFIDKVRQQQQEQGQDVMGQSSLNSRYRSSSSSMPTLTQIEAFLLALTNPNRDGRIVVTYSNGSAEMKYMLLNPAEVFRPVVEEARSIILAGGTMEPVSDFINFLFPDVPEDRISRLSCGHIIPPSNLSVIALDEGPSGKPFTFTFEHRQQVELMDEVGQTIVNLCNIIPDGVVCFFASFSYLEQLYARWRSTDVLDRIQKRKKVFKEPREANKVESTLRDYALQIDGSDRKSIVSGALLLCVVNGKMSEGINFSDRLGRGVIMVGLPFADRRSVELQEKMKYARAQMGELKSIDGGKEYYENLCMRGVNQSIGRAIRHKNDYATIVLLDRRYATPRIKNKLPGWISGNVQHCEKFGKAMSKTVQFFRQFRNNNSM